MPSPSQLQSPWGSLLSRSVERVDFCEGSRDWLELEDWESELWESDFFESDCEESCSAAGAFEVSAPPLRGPPQFGQAPAPWVARTFSPMAIVFPDQLNQVGQEGGR